MFAVRETSGLLQVSARTHAQPQTVIGRAECFTSLFFQALLNFVARQGTPPPPHRGSNPARMCDYTDFKCFIHSLCFLVYFRATGTGPNFYYQPDNVTFSLFCLRSTNWNGPDSLTTKSAVILKSVSVRKKYIILWGENIMSKLQRIFFYEDFGVGLLWTTWLFCFLIPWKDNTNVKSWLVKWFIYLWYLFTLQF